MHTILQVQLGENPGRGTSKLTEHWLIRSTNVPTPQPTIDTRTHDLIGVSRMPVDISYSATVNMQHMFDCHFPIKE